MTESLKRRGSHYDIFVRKNAGQEKKKENLKCTLEGIAVILLLSLFFYRSLLALPFLTPVYLLYRKEKRRTVLKNRRKETAMQFKDAILAVSANQKAGYSVENSFRQSYEDMALLYGKESIICRELHGILTGLNNNLVLEKLLYDFGKRSGVEDIIEFAEVFSAAKRNGGNLTEVIERSVSVIEDKVETEKEIQVLVSAKQMEQKVMNVVPFGILLYINATSKGFFDVLYHNIPGVLIMTACMGIYIAAVLLSKKIVNIEV